MESWLYDTKKEAEKEAIAYGKEEGLKVVEVGMCDEIPLPCYVDSDTILDHLHEQYADVAGGEYEDNLYNEV
jgi:hypothetical protein